MFLTTLLLTYTENKTKVIQIKRIIHKKKGNTFEIKKRNGRNLSVLLFIFHTSVILKDVRSCNR